MPASTYPHSGVNLRVDGWTVWPDGDEHAFHITVNDPRFTHAKAQDGLRFVAASSPLSANYNPREFNRILRAFQAEGHLLDWSEIPERQRHITNRTALIIEYLRNGSSW